MNNNNNNNNNPYYDPYQRQLPFDITISPIGGGGFYGGFPGGGYQGGGFGGGFPGGGGYFPPGGGGFPPTSPPPFGGGYPGGGGFPGGGGGAGQDGPPSSPPPSFVPQQNVSAFAVDPGGIARCRYRFTYIWLNNGRSFWYYPTFVGRNSIAGYRWRRRQGWVYFGIDLDRISSFQCGGF